jgi:hypothetical protein
MVYHNKPLVIQTIQGGACGYGENVDINTPSVDPSESSADSFQFTSSDCARNIYTVRLINQASGAAPAPSPNGQDGPSGCIGAIQTDPNPGSNNAKPGYGFCVQGSDNFIAYVKIASVDSQGEVTLRVDGWSTS